MRTGDLDLTAFHGKRAPQHSSQDEAACAGPSAPWSLPGAGTAPASPPGKLQRLGAIDTREGTRSQRRKHVINRCSGRLGTVLVTPAWLGAAPLTKRVRTHVEKLRGTRDPSSRDDTSSPGVTPHVQSPRRQTRQNCLLRARKSGVLVAFHPTVPTTWTLHSPAGRSPGRPTPRSL